MMLEDGSYHITPTDRRRSMRVLCDILHNVYGPYTVGDCVTVGDKEGVIKAVYPNFEDSGRYAYAVKFVLTVGDEQEIDVFSYDQIYNTTVLEGGNSYQKKGKTTMVQHCSGCAADWCDGCAPFTRGDMIAEKLEERYNNAFARWAEINEVLNGYETFNLPDVAYRAYCRERDALIAWIEKLRYRLLLVGVDIDVPPVAQPYAVIRIVIDKQSTITELYRSSSLSLCRRVARRLSDGRVYPTIKNTWYSIVDETPDTYKIGE